MRLGADPEVFLQNEQGSLVSAIGLVNADKWNPLQLPHMKKGFTLQEDNVALEYGIPPAQDADEFVKNIQAVMKASLPFIKDLSFSKLSCAVFPKEELNHPLAHVFGCEPDIDAWTGKENPKPKAPNPNLRSAGGHVHVETTKDAREVGKRMDLYLGIPSLFMDQGHERRALYGAPGAIRFKPYGLEYRTLSNFWIFDEKYIRWVWRNAQRAESSNLSFDEETGWLLREAILKNDKNIAEAFVTEYSLEVV